MVERFLAELYQRVSREHKKIGIFIAGNMLDDNFLSKLPELKNKMKDVGELKISTILFEGDLQGSYFKALQNAGFSHKILPTNEELYFLIEVYDTYLREDIDILILGTTSELLIPMYTEIKKKSTLYALVNNKEELGQAFIESFDGIIEINNLEGFTFDEKPFPEFSIESAAYISNESVQTVDLANIGITSEKISFDE